VSASVSSEMSSVAGVAGAIGRPPVRPVLTWVPSEDLTALDMAMDWHALLTGSVPGATCIWTTRPVNRRPAHPAVDELCWHVVDLPIRLDRHLPDADRRMPWSPWGSKSGPNHQFFTILDALPTLHDDDWVLFIEPDTHPLRDDAAACITALLTAHPEAWMVGGVPHANVRPFLARDLWHHINGAALYRVTDDGFARFRTEVWLPSLLLRIRAEPKYAFDCVTDPAQWMLLPSALRAQWERAAGRFVRTAGIVNLSSLSLSVGQVADALEDIDRWQGCEDRVAPWMVHVKGELMGIRDALVGSAGSGRWVGA